MYSWLDLRRFRYFIAIVEHGSISEAARVLHVAQPALSHHLREMEKGFGDALLMRSRKGVTMTPIGEVLYSCAKDVIARLEEANTEFETLRASRRLQAQSLRVGIISSLSSAVTPRLLSAAADAMPSVSLHISEKAVHESHALVVEGKLDFAITLDSTDWKHTHPLITEELFFVSAPSMSQSDTPIPLSELGKHRLILPSLENSVLRPSVETLAQKNGFSLAVALEIDGLSPRKEAVIAGLGATILPIVSIATEVANGNLVIRRFDPPITRRIILKARVGVDPLITTRLRAILKSVLDEVTLPTRRI